MDAEEYKWRVNLDKSRLEYLNLTFEQAEKVYAHEEEKRIASEHHFFSDWEEWDYDLSMFREILDAAQFERFERRHIENIRRYEKALVDGDKPNTVDIAYTRDIQDFYEQRLLPAFQKNKYGQPFLGASMEGAKVDYLRKEHQKFLQEQKKKMLTQHFRHYRSFKPNALALSLQKHKLRCTFPDYPYFKHYMDAPTKAVATYLESRFQNLTDDVTRTIAEKFEELANFTNDRFEKHYGKISLADTYVVTVPPLGETERAIQNTMTILLLDQEK